MLRRRQWATPFTIPFRELFMSFDSLGLSASLLKAVSAQGYDTPSPIQAQAIPAVLAGKDVMAAAQTGTGKTAGFTLPILELLSTGERAQPNQVRALILTPTRELAAQVAESVETYGQHLPLSSTVVFGGVKINPQMMKLRRGCDVLVATPGRLLDLYNQNSVKFKQLEILVLDEADRMLDMGFIRDIKKILSFLPAKRQNLMFSATFSDEIRTLAKGMVNNPVEISVSPRNTTVESVEQWVCPVDKNAKSQVLTRLIKDNEWAQVLVFSRTKHGANRLTKHLDSKGIQAAAIHGNKSQGARTKALADFKSGATRVLVATDIAARGLDIDQLPQVVNFDLPNVAEDYVHRIGRTGRAGATGQAVSLVSADEAKLLFAIEKLTQKIIERKPLEGFDPVNDLPPSRLGQPGGSGSSARRPKQPRSGHRDGQRSGENARGHRPAGNRASGNRTSGNR
ncbi:MAG: ATP-dependent RNA helicase RhlE [Paraglaciecola psychrophila]|jgi:ATP-dependent RNA helicase RhlE